MNRKVAYLIMLFLYVIVGAGAFYAMKNPGLLPTFSFDIASKEATISAPEGTHANTTESEAETPEEVAEPFEASDTEASSQPDNSTTTNASEVSEEKEEPQYTYTAIQRSKHLNIRENPSLKAKIIGVLLPGETGEVISIGEEWVLVKHDELEGYVFKEYLKLTEVE